jgi:hypothetical protein
MISCSYILGTSFEKLPSGVETPNRKNGGRICHLGLTPGISQLMAGALMSL